MKKTLVIMAAGIGSRFGDGIKQLEPVGPNGEIIMDYSVHDAIEAGFTRIVFIIRKDIESDFKEVIGNRIERVCIPFGIEIKYAYQELCFAEQFVKGDVVGISSIPMRDVLRERKKPWGTGHAILSCIDLIDGPFAVINADDYYGKEGLRKAALFMEETNGESYGLIGYKLRNTLSDNGGVTRGICLMEGERLTGIEETKEIVKVTDGESVYAKSKGKKIDIDSIVSMNFWCYPEGFMQVLEKGFPEFLSNMEKPLEDEYLLPTIVDGLLKQGTEVSVIPTNDKWFGVTYKEDKESVVQSFRQLYQEEVYSSELYSDIKSVD